MEWGLRLALPFRPQMLKRRPPVWSGVKSGAKGASNANFEWRRCAYA
jgi:hypothetical protein